MNRMKSLIASSTLAKHCIVPVLAVGTIAALASHANAQFFTPGNLVVSRSGTGAATLNGNSTAIFLDQFQCHKRRGWHLACPADRRFRRKSRRPPNSGSATSNGVLHLSGNGQYLLYAGYDTTVALGGVATSTSTAVNRVIARVDGAGNHQCYDGP